MMTIPWALAVPGIIFLAIVAPIWLICHYATVWVRMRAGPGKVVVERAELERMARSLRAARTEDRVAGDHPGRGNAGLEETMSRRHSHHRDHPYRDHPHRGSSPTGTPPRTDQARGPGSRRRIRRLAGPGHRRVRSRIRLRPPADPGSVLRGVVLGGSSRAHALLRGASPGGHLRRAADRIRRGVAGAQHGGEADREPREPPPRFVDPAALGRRFEALERRARDIEAFVASEEFRLNREFRRMERE